MAPLPGGKGLSPIIVLPRQGRTLEVPAGGTLLDALASAGITVEATCGGQGRCARCRAVVRGPAGPVTDDERRLLTAEELDAGWRLLCRAEINEPGGKITVELPSMEHVVSTLKSTALRPISTDGHVVLARVALPPALEDPRLDLARVEDALRDGFSIEARCDDQEAVASLSSVLRSSGWRADVALRGPEIIGARGASSLPAVGIAVGVGTSKLAVYLIDMENGEQLEAAAVPNPQSAFGEDIISRVQRGSDSPGDARVMKEKVMESINALTLELASSRNIRPSELCESVLVGNTVMHHLALGLPVASLGRSPFAPVTNLAMDTLSRGLGIDSMPGAESYFPAIIAGFVGSDHLAALVATGLESEVEPCLLIDVGANTEVSLAAGGRIRCCSCASAPAFEGGGLRFGMRAFEGAINSVWIEEGQIEFSTVGGVSPRGICGSGILDTLVVMLRSGALDESGRIIEGATDVENVDGERVFLLAEADHCRRITVGQADVREVQKAKAAIRAGIELLLADAGVLSRELSKILLAGSFGTGIDPAAAIEVAMLPPVDPEKVVPVGDAAGHGACMLLCSRGERESSELLARRVQHLELARHPDFPFYFAAATGLSERAFSEKLTRLKKPEP